ncbi:MAG: hypothetical protein QJR07_18955 [Acetobacteraceae bacterium]|nr:hypothetical protein [Acetobacteraceae bacterium]
MTQNRADGLLARVQAARTAIRGRNAEKQAMAEWLFRNDDDVALAARLPEVADAFGPDFALRLAADRLSRPGISRRIAARFGALIQDLVNVVEVYLVVITNLILDHFLLVRMVAAGLAVFIVILLLL